MTKSRIEPTVPSTLSATAQMVYRWLLATQRLGSARSAISTLADGRGLALRGYVRTALKNETRHEPFRLRMVSAALDGLTPRDLELLAFTVMQAVSPAPAAQPRPTVRRGSSR